MKILVTVPHLIKHMYSIMLINLNLYDTVLETVEPDLSVSSMLCTWMVYHLGMQLGWKWLSLWKKIDHINCDGSNIAFDWYQVSISLWRNGLDFWKNTVHVPERNLWLSFSQSSWMKAFLEHQKVILAEHLETFVHHHKGSSVGFGHSHSHSIDLKFPCI